MDLRVFSEDKIRFDVHIQHDDSKVWAVLELDGGAWYLNRDGAKHWMASRNIAWPEALRRACLWLAGGVECDRSALSNFFRTNPLSRRFFDGGAK